MRWASTCACCVLILAPPAAAAPPAPKMLKGPYLQNLAPTSITVMWQMDAEVPAKLVVTGPGPAGGVRTIEVAPARIVEARIDKLEPASRYRYQVVVGTETWEGELRTAPPEGKDVPFTFVVYGDSRDGIEQHRRVIDRITQEVPDFVLGTGDMVDAGFREDQWQQFFDIEEPLLRDNVYFPALGNHDRQGRGRTADTYRAYFSVPQNGGETERYYAFSYASARFLVLDSNAYSFALTEQTAWLERELVAARQDPSVRHIFVAMHHPTFSISLHGGNIDLRERWMPLFEKYQVSAVFSGHDHVYERAEHDGLHYFVSGGAGAPLYPKRASSNPVDVEAVKKFERALHYLRVTVTGTRIEVTGVRADGTVIETTAWSDGPLAVVSATGAPATPPQTVMSVPTVAPPTPEPTGSPLWWAIGGLVVVLGAAVVVVVSLRR
ncbi:MAG: metallophosphoesterase family protein [Kofleriaceae bacterium]